MTSYVPQTAATTLRLWQTKHLRTNVNKDQCTEKNLKCPALMYIQRIKEVKKGRTMCASFLAPLLLDSLIAAGGSSQRALV